MTDFEVIIDPVELAIGQGLWMDERHEVLPHGEFVHWLQRVLERDDLFVYVHREVGSFVLAHWMLDPRGHTPRVCLELDTFDAPPDWIHNRIERADFWKYRMVGSRQMAQRMHQQIRDRHSELRAAKEETYTQRQETSKWMRHKGMEQSAKLLSDGVPFLSAREAALQGGGAMNELSKLKGD